MDNAAGYRRCHCWLRSAKTPPGYPLTLGKSDNALVSFTAYRAWSTEHGVKSKHPTLAQVSVGTAGGDGRRLPRLPGPGRSPLLLLQPQRRRRLLLQCHHDYVHPHPRPRHDRRFHDAQPGECRSPEKAKLVDSTLRVTMTVRLRFCLQASAVLLFLIKGLLTHASVFLLPKAL